MNNRYEELEDELAGLLQGNFFEAKPLPDNEADFKPSMKPKVYVMYDNSDFPESENLGMVVQEDKMKIGFEIHARTRRGPEGIFAIQKMVYKKILGYKPFGCNKFQLISFGPLAGNKPNEWMYYAQFTTTSHIAESQEETEGPLLNQISFVNNEL